MRLRQWLMFGVFTLAFFSTSTSVAQKRQSEPHVSRAYVELLGTINTDYVSDWLLTYYFGYWNPEPTLQVKRQCGEWYGSPYNLSNQGYVYCTLALTDINISFCSELNYIAGKYSMLVEQAWYLKNPSGVDKYGRDCETAMDNYLAELRECEINAGKYRSGTGGRLINSVENAIWDCLPDIHLIL